MLWGVVKEILAIWGWGQSSQEPRKTLLLKWLGELARYREAFQYRNKAETTYQNLNGAGVFRTRGSVHQPFHLYAFAHGIPSGFFI